MLPITSPPIRRKEGKVKLNKIEKGDVVYCEKHDSLAIVSKNNMWLGMDGKEYVPTHVKMKDSLFNVCFLPQDLTLISKHDFKEE